MAKKFDKDRRWHGGATPATHCARNHKLTPENTVKVGKEHRPRCRICRQQIDNASKARRRKAKEESTNA
jgi:hypothetical protein